MIHTPFVGVDLSPGSTGLVALEADGQAVVTKHLEVAESKTSFTARRAMAMAAIEWIRRLPDCPLIVGVEDYALGMGQNVGYQIAEVGGIFRHEVVNLRLRTVLINPRKRQSYVLKQKKVDKDAVIAWASDQGFNPPVKARGGPGYNKRQREDLADAFTCARMAKHVHELIRADARPIKNDIFLSPDTGLCYRQDLLLNLSALGN